MLGETKGHNKNIIFYHFEEEKYENFDIWEFWEPNSCNNQQTVLLPILLSSAELTGKIDFPSLRPHLTRIRSREMGPALPFRVSQLIFHTNCR